jgi:hypothetical protein
MNRKIVARYAPMDLVNMRSSGVTRLDAYCGGRRTRRQHRSLEHGDTTPSPGNSALKAAKPIGNIAPPRTRAPCHRAQRALPARRALCAWSRCARLVRSWSAIGSSGDPRNHSADRRGYQNRHGKGRAVQADARSRPRRRIQNDRRALRNGESLYQRHHGVQKQMG